jgi:hypothetical protein
MRSDTDLFELSDEEMLLVLEGIELVETEEVHVEDYVTIDTDPYYES